MPHRFQKVDWKKTLDSIPKDVADLLQKGFDEQNEKDFISLCTSLKRKHSKKCTFYTLRFGCSFAAVNTIKPQLL